MGAKGFELAESSCESLPVKATWTGISHSSTVPTKGNRGKLKVCRRKEKKNQSVLIGDSPKIHRRMSLLISCHEIETRKKEKGGMEHIDYKHEHYNILL